MQEALKLLQTVDLNELRANQNSVSRIQYPSEDQSVLGKSFCYLLNSIK